MLPSVDLTNPVTLAVLAGLAVFVVYRWYRWRWRVAWFDRVYAEVTARELDDDEEPSEE